MTSWPATLPLPQIDHSGQPLQATVASSLENARIQRRSRFRSSIIVLAVQWNLDLAELDAFKLFFEVDLDNGAALFEIELRHPLTTALMVWVVRFVGGYSYSCLEGRWSVEAQLELLRMPLPDAAARLGWQPFYVVSLESGDEFIPFADALEVNYTVKQ